MSNCVFCQREIPGPLAARCRAGSACSAGCAEASDAREWLVKLNRSLGDEAPDLDSRTLYDLGARLSEALDLDREGYLEALRCIDDRGCERSWSIPGRCLTRDPEGDWCAACIAASVLPPAKLAPGVVLTRQVDLDAAPEGACGRDANDCLVLKVAGGWRRCHPAFSEPMSIREPMHYVRLLDLGGPL